jgi:hypothetical protein
MGLLHGVLLACVADASLPRELDSDDVVGVVEGERHATSAVLISCPTLPYPSAQGHGSAQSLYLGTSVLLLDAACVACTACGRISVL